MRRSNSREQLNLMLSSALEIHDKLLELNDSNIDSTITFLNYSTPFLKDKLLLRKVLFMVNNLMSCRPLKFQTFYSLLSNATIMKPISKFFTSDELFSIFEMNKPVLALLFDNKLVSIQQLDKNLDYYVDNQDHFFFFHREIKASSIRRYEHSLNSNPEFYEFVNEKSKNLSEHQIYRKSGANESIIAQVIRKDDVEGLVKTIKTQQKRQQNSKRFSIDIDLSHYNIEFNCNAQDGSGYSSPKSVKKSGTQSEIEPLAEEEEDNYCNYIYYSFDMEVPHSIYEVTQFDIMFGTYPTLIEYAAFLGSVKVFKYLLKKLHVTCQEDVSLKSIRPRKNSYSKSNMSQGSFSMGLEYPEETSTDPYSKLMRFAVAGGCKEIIELLYEKGFRFDVRCLNTAIEFHQIKIAEYIHNTEQIHFDFYSLSKAVISYNIRALIDVLKESNNIKLVSRFNNWDVLQIAAQAGQLETIRFLVEERKMDINRQNSLGNTCLQLACENGFADIVEYLLHLTKKTLNPPSNNQNNRDQNENESNIVVSKITNKVYINDNLNENETDENPNNNNANTDDINTYNTTNNDDDEFIVDVNIEIDEKGNALQYAVRNAHLKVVKLLCEHKGIELNSRNANAETPLFVACKHNFVEIAQYLCSLPGVDINARADNFMTPLLIASKYGLLKIVKILCGKNKTSKLTSKPVPSKKGASLGSNENDDDDDSNFTCPSSTYCCADLNVRGEKRMTPLLIAVKSNCPTVVEFLVNLEGVDANATNKYGENALHIAASCNDGLKILQILLKTGKFDVNARSKLNGETMLHVAAKNGAEEVFNFLLSSAADLSLDTEAKDATGQTAQEVMQEYKRKKSKNSK